MIHRTRVKMCGTTNVEDANFAVRLGVDALGFIFTPKSQRFITPEGAREIINGLPPFFFKVGVFVDEVHQEVEEVVHYLGLNGVQLHGNEDPSYCENLSLSIPSTSLIKAFRVDEKNSPSDFEPYDNVVDGFLLDTYIKGKAGGTGLTFDWGLLKKLNLKRPAIVAGGLNPSNINMALDMARPFGVDVNSGVELSPGRKDHDKLVRFIENVAKFDRTMV